MPEINVVIPTYNRATTQRRALDSVPAQSVRNIEVLVVDDGSTDDPVAVATAQAVGEARIRVRRLERDK